MKDKSTTPTVQRVGSFTESKFGIASSEDLVYIFDILRNKLYSDKALAVVREYTTNAADANTEAGHTNKPIVITAPSQMSPHFKVRDFGNGLSEEDVRSVYCMYGRSTKRNSNAFTGQLGLGSKSGFAYGDSFTITSFFNGLKSVYTAYIDETKLGAVAKISESKTNEEPGVEITIPVKSADISVFQRKIEEVCKFFKVTPVIHGNVIISPIEKQFSGSNWSIQSSRNSYGPKQATAVMGNIGYPIDASQVYPSDYNDYWRSKSKGLKMLMAQSIIHFNIGDLSIAASREELEYNPATIEAIKRAASTAWSEFHGNLQTDINKCKDGLEARAFMYRLNQASSGNWGDITSSIKWNGSVVPGYLVSPDRDLVSIDVYSFNGTHYSKSQNAAMTVEDKLLKDDLMFLCDEISGQTTKMNQIAKENLGKACYLFKIKTRTESDGKTTDGLSWFTDHSFPIERLKKLSEVKIDKTTQQPRKNGNSIGKGNMKAYQLAKKLTSWGTQSENWIEVIKPKSEIKYHVIIEKFKVLPPGVGARDAVELEALIKAVDKHVCHVPEYFAIKQSDLSKIEDTSECLFEHLKSQMLSSQKLKDELLSSLNRTAIGKTMSGNHSYMTYLKGLVAKYDAGEFKSDKPFHKAMALVKSYLSKDTVKSHELRDVINKFYTIEQMVTNSESEISAVFEELDKTYTILQFIGHVYPGNYNAVTDSISSYVNMIDSI
jgi:hypothetical protein